MVFEVDGVFIVTQTAIQRLLAAKRPASIINMASISANVGFTDSNYFARAFRRIKGMPPRQYRQS